MVEDIGIAILFGSIIWYWGSWLQKTVGRRENDVAHFPEFIQRLRKNPEKKISISGNSTKVFSIWIWAYILVILELIDITIWKDSVYFVMMPVLVILLILENWARWFR